jgi:hypothetical protein
MMLDLDEPAQARQSTRLEKTVRIQEGPCSSRAPIGQAQDFRHDRARLEVRTAKLEALSIRVWCLPQAAEEDVV